MWPCCVKTLRLMAPFRRAIEPPWLSLSFCSHADTQKKVKMAPLQERRMIDRFKLHARGGNGGNGCFSVSRSRRDRHGRPDGGNGGRGGDVILECSPTIWDFSCLRHHANAGQGGHGASKNKIGTRGTHKVVHVPVGIVIHLLKGEMPYIVQKEFPADPDPWDLPGSLGTSASEFVDQSPFNNNLGSTEEAESQDKTQLYFHPGSMLKYKTMVKQLIQDNRSDALSHSDHSSEPQMEGVVEDEAQILYNVIELKEKGQRVIIAQGGEGGPGNVSLGKFPKPLKHEAAMNRGGAFDFEETDGGAAVAPSSIGFPGSESILILELKSIADVGLVGMPNAGKSTLLGAISRAKPTLGHYAFTTLRPNLGNLNFDDFSITVADIPGLIKGAHENRGLGHAFLRYIERTKVLAFVVDLASGLDGRKGIPPWEQLRDLILELEHHQEGLSCRPALIIANKIDGDGAEAVLEELKRRVKGVAPIYPDCAVLEEGVAELKDGLRDLASGGESSVLNIADFLQDEIIGPYGLKLSRPRFILLFSHNFKSNNRPLLGTKKKPSHRPLCLCTAVCLV